MDGTLVNSEPHWLAAETELMAEFGHTWVLADQQYCLGGPLDKVGRYMSDLSGGAHSWEWFRKELIARTMKHVESHVEFMPGAYDLLSELKAAGVPLGLVTASPRAMMEATLVSLGEDFFDIAISGDDVKVTKPDPEAYFLAANQLHVDIRKSIVIEDSLTGIAAAKASGAFVLAVPHIVKIEHSDRVVILESLKGTQLSDLKVFIMNKVRECCRNGYFQIWRQSAVNGCKGEGPNHHVEAGWRVPHTQRMDRS